MNRRVLGGMKALPIEDVEKYIGEQIGILRVGNRPNALHMAMSIAEYLKDARRWQYAETHELPSFPILTGKALREHVDKERRK